MDLGWFYLSNIDMRSFEELKGFIELKASEYNAIDEGACLENLWQCESIEAEILRAVALFSASEGVMMSDGVNLALYIENLQKGESDFENTNAWDEWRTNQLDIENDVRDGLYLLAQAKQLPEKTQFLHDIWTQRCYPDFYVD
jgi:hypothetical protein